MVKKNNNKNLISALSIAFLDNFGGSFVFILFAPLILNPSYGFFSAELSEGTKNILLGIVIGIFPIFLFYGAPFWGDYADRFGRKKAFSFTILGTVAGHLLCGLAIYLESYTFLLLTRAFTGFFSGNLSICMATISDISANAKVRARNFGIVVVMMGIGWILAMLLGGYFSDSSISAWFSPTLPFILAALLTFGGYLIVRFLFTETNVENSGVHFSFTKSMRDIKDAMKQREMRPYFLTLFFWGLGWSCTYPWFTAVSIENYAGNQQTASLYLAILGIFWVLGGVLINPFLAKRVSSFSVALVSIFMVGLFLILTSVASLYIVFVILFWMAAICSILAYSNSLNIVSYLASGKSQGVVMGFTQSLLALAMALSPFVAGVFAKTNTKWVFPAGGVFLMIAFCILLTHMRKLKAKKT
jgi:MFS family permease